MIVLALIVACGTGTINLDGAQHHDSVFSDDSVVADDSMTADDSVFSDDKDGDGYDAIAAGGDDCNDADPDIHPDATEIWYDGVDQNCDGSSDYDQDGDGVDSQAVRGIGSTDYADCDDDGDGFDISPCFVDSNHNGVFDNDPNVQVEGVHPLGNPDCDDIDPGRFPTNPEIIGNEYDENCDGIDTFGIKIEWPSAETGTLFLTVTGDSVTNFIIHGPGIEFQVMTLSDSIEDAATYLAAFDVVSDNDYSPGQDETSLGAEAAAGEVGYLLRTASDIHSVGTRCVVWGPLANDFANDEGSSGCVDITAYMGHPNRTDYAWNGR